jgi:uncharacterized RDD family membrane protein YckC
MTSTTTATPTEGATTQYGGFWIRFVAFFLDGIILTVVTAALAPLLGLGSVFSTDAGGGVNAGAQGLNTALGLFYFVGFWAWRGQTPGMIPFRLRVVKASDGSKPDWVVGLLRYVGLIISIIVIFIGLIWAAFDSRKQGWHDKIAGTLVVRDPA